MNNHITVIAKYSLAGLWIFTGLTSAFFAPEIGIDILVKYGFSIELAQEFTYAGAILDIAIGLWILSLKYQKLCSIAQICIIVTFTFLLTIIDATFWLHPFGPITKNIPIIVLIIIVYCTDNK